MEVEQRLPFTTRWMREHRSQLRQYERLLRKFLHGWLSLAGLAIVGILVFLTLFGPSLVPYPADAGGTVHLTQKLKPPSAEHWMGTDEVGRDLFSRVVVGARYTLLAALLVVAIAIAIGTPMGAAGGYYGGVLAAMVSRTADIFLTIPRLVFALAIVAAIGGGIINSMLAIGLVWWPGYTRLALGAVQSLKTEAYVETARSLGASDLRLIFVHILPNMVPSLMVKASLDMGLAVLVASGMGFIGVGAQPPIPEWGAMVAAGRHYFPAWWWYSIYPGLAIFVVVLGFNLLGDGLRDALDPQTPVL